MNSAETKCEISQGVQHLLGGARVFIKYLMVLH